MNQFISISFFNPRKEKWWEKYCSEEQLPANYITCTNLHMLFHAFSQKLKDILALMAGVQVINEPSRCQTGASSISTHIRGSGWPESENRSAVLSPLSSSLTEESVSHQTVKEKQRSWCQPLTLPLQGKHFDARTVQGHTSLADTHLLPGKCSELYSQLPWLLQDLQSSLQLTDKLWFWTW
jgi:hypothetical protein